MNVATIHPDWAQFTVHGTPSDDVLHGLLNTWPDLVIEPAIPQKGYRAAVELYRDGEYFCDLSHGGRNGDEYGPHLRAKSAGAADCIELARNHWPDDLAFSRLDMAANYYEPGAFDELVTIALDVARESSRPMAPDQRGNWLDSDLGGTRTLGLGARKSAAYLRVYERGLYLRHRFPELAAAIDPNWIRAEIEVKPKTVEGKRLLARAPLLDAWGAAAWSQKFADRALGESVDRIAVGSAQSPVRTLDGQEEWLVDQGGKIIAKLMRRHGSPEAFQAWLLAQLRLRGHDV